MKYLVAILVTAAGLLFAPMASADGGYLDSGTYDDLLGILDEDGTQGEWSDSVLGEWDPDGSRPGEMYPAGPAHSPQ